MVYLRHETSKTRRQLFRNIFMRSVNPLQSNHEISEIAQTFVDFLDYLQMNMHRCNFINANVSNCCRKYKNHIVAD